MSTPLSSAASMPSWPPEATLEAIASAQLAERGPCKAALPDLAVVSVSGADARTFLHAQLAADLKNLGPGQSVLTAWCSAQGRVLFLPRIVATNDRFDLIVHRLLAPKLVQRLRMFVLRAQVTITAREALVFGFTADDATDLPAIDTAAEHEDVTVLRLASARPRCLVFGAPEAALRSWQCRPEPIVQADAWTLLDIQDGLPGFDPALSDQLLPQNFNLDAGPGISFTKGCYPGQEVIARLKYRGRVKSRLMRGTIVGGPEIAPGTKLYAPGEAAASTLGIVVSAAQNAAGGRDVLAVVDFERLAEGPAALDAPDGAQLRFAPAPGSPA